MPGRASQDMLLHDLFELIYQIVMYLLWSQSVFNSNDECRVVCIVMTAPCNTLPSFQFLSFLWKTELPVPCQPNKPNSSMKCSQWHKALSDLAGEYRVFCSASPVVSEPKRVWGSSLGLVHLGRLISPHCFQ